MTTYPTIGSDIIIVLSDGSELRGFVQDAPQNNLVLRTSAHRTKTVALAAITSWTYGF